MNTADAVIIAIAIVIMYVLPTILVWLYFNKAHSIGGIWESMQSEGIQVFLTLCPVVNIICSLQWLLFPPTKNKNIINTDKFFNIKK